MNINTSERICLIVNPKAGSGSAKSKLATVQEQVGNYFQHWDIRKTQAAGHAESLAKQACEEGFDLIAVIGGDGTCHEIINGMIDQDKAINPKTSLALIPAGTGSDFMKSLPTPNDPIQALQAAAFGKSRIIDVGKCITKNQTRYFINVAGFGVNGEVAERSNNSSKMFGGKVTFIKATLQSSLSYKPQPVKLEWKNLDTTHNWSGELLSCFVANGKFCGGGMNVGPDSKIDDGLADITLLSPIGPIEQLFKLRKLYDGTVHELKQAKHMRSPLLKASATQNACVKIELDGECGGSLPASFYILPKILPLRSFWESA
ncbi:MAG: diacylglycerol kinase family protein [Myxococcota bacterium]|nr:diacylglycerol kinase family protein [Myxococcota bacterium]